MIIEPRSLSGKITIPPSKSITHRAFILACIAGGSVHNPLISEDTESTLEVLKKMGAEFHWKVATPVEENIEVTNDILVVDRTISHGSGEAECGNSGTTLRLLTAVASLFPQSSDLGGDDSLNSRPIAGLVDALVQLGADVKCMDGRPPVLIKGPLPKGFLSCSIPGNVSSQYISGLLIALSARGEDSEINVLGNIVSKPYIDLTVQMLGDCGGEITEHKGVYRIHASSLHSHDYIVSADFSSLAFFAVAGAFQKKTSIHMGRMDTRYSQADSKIVEIVEKFGGIVKWDGTELVVSGGDLKGCDIDLGSSPDLFPIVSVLAAKAFGSSKLYGASHLRFKETDRIKAVVEMLEQMGVEVEELDDGCIVHGTGYIKGGCSIRTYGDHRIAMAATIAGTVAESPVEIDDPSCVSVSFPSFFKVLDSISQYKSPVA